MKRHAVRPERPSTARRLVAASGLLAACFLSAGHAGAAIQKAVLDGVGFGGNGVTVVDEPRRAGTKALRHSINGGNRSEVEDSRLVDGTYWYGWSFRHPATPAVPGGGWTILMQMFVGSRPASDWPCGGAGHKLVVRGGKLLFDLQHSTSGGSGITCKSFDLLPFSEIRDKWVDVVIHASWTSEPDGFLKLWLRVGGEEGTWTQKIDYKGRTRAFGGRGQYLKMGAYTEGNATRIVYTDEYRRGGADGTFEEVAPGVTNMTLPSAPGDGGVGPEVDGGAADAGVEEEPEPQDASAEASPTPPPSDAAAPVQPPAASDAGALARPPRAPRPPTTTPQPPSDTEEEPPASAKRGGGGCSVGAVGGPPGGLTLLFCAAAAAGLRARRRRGAGRG
jgi:hypothetical protein